jgi:glycosyltransferase involved in cell wall biosynthesis
MLAKIIRRFKKMVNDIIILDDIFIISGFLKSEIGLGEAARSIIKAVDSARVPVSLHDYPLKGRNLASEYADRIEKQNLSKFQLVVLPPTELNRCGRIAKEVNSILYPYWELPRLNPKWVRKAQAFREIWAPSRYIEKMFLDAGFRTTLVPQPVRIQELRDSVPHRDSKLKILTYFDFDSRPARKNIHGTIQAFQQAFPVHGDVELLIKCRGAHDEGTRSYLGGQIASDRRLTLIDSYLSLQEMSDLLTGCDVFISLHRSEGFGFGPAEALAAGKPVISTDYSGTTDFISEDTGYPVRYSLIPVKKGEYPEWKDQEWADPDINHAAEVLQSIYTNPEEARIKGMKGREFMINNHSPEVIGKQIKQLLMERGFGTDTAAS